MNLLAYILAAQEFSWTQIVIIAIVFGLSIIGSIYQKTKEKQEKDKARKPRGESRATRTAPPAVPQTARPQAPTENTVRVSEELRLRQQRQVQLDSDRQKRLAARTSPESDTSAIEARLVSVHPDEADTAPRRISEDGIILSLDTPAEAQRAIILHEIFSPPKALRKGDEMWDT